VTEALRQRDDVAAVLDPQRGVAMPQAVEGGARQPSSFQRRVQPSAEDVAVAVRLSGGGAEDEVVVAAEGGPELLLAEHQRAPGAVVSGCAGERFGRGSPFGTVRTRLGLKKLRPVAIALDECFQDGGRLWEVIAFDWGLAKQEFSSVRGVRAYREQGRR
jgi:hypothetical protein